MQHSLKKKKAFTAAFRPTCLQPIVAHHCCHTNVLFPFTTTFPSLSYHTDRPSPSFHATLVACGPSQVRHRSRSHLSCWEGLFTVHRNYQLVSYVPSFSLCFRSPSLYPRISFLLWAILPFLTSHSYTLVVYTPTVTLLTTIQ